MPQPIGENRHDVGPNVNTPSASRSPPKSYTAGDAVLSLLSRPLSSPKDGEDSHLSFPWVPLALETLATASRS